MKHHVPLMLRLTAIFAFIACGKEKQPSPAPAAAGKYTFFIKSDLGVGNITVKIEGQVAGVISHYHGANITCGQGDVNIEKPPGTYNWVAQGASGGYWSGRITFANGNCTTFELTAPSQPPPNPGGNPSTPTVTNPSTLFIASQDYTVSNHGAFWHQSFTIGSAQTYIFRFAAEYMAQAAIIDDTQLDNFRNMRGFNAYSLFDKTSGTKMQVTLPPGTYYLAVRNANNGKNKWSVELDHTVKLPASDQCTFYDTYLSDTKAFTSATRHAVPFSVQTGLRYFIDGCNVNCQTYIIPGSQLTPFMAGQTFQYYTDYADKTGNGPGGYEIKGLAPGNYYLVSYNPASPAVFTYVMERWKKN